MSLSPDHSKRTARTNVQISLIDWKRKIVENCSLICLQLWIQLSVDLNLHFDLPFESLGSHLDLPLWSAIWIYYSDLPFGSAIQIYHSDLPFISTTRISPGSTLLSALGSHFEVSSENFERICSARLPFDRRPSDRRRIPTAFQRMPVDSNRFPSRSCSTEPLWVNEHN